MEGNGSCLFFSIRRLLAIPTEYTNTHLRREVVFHLISNMEAYGPDLIPLVRGIYGAGNENTYPQSICSYLQDMLKAWYWADEIVLRAMSIMFNVTITVIRAETGLEVKVRHNRPLVDADIVLTLTNSGHYSPAG